MRLSVIVQFTIKHQHHHLTKLSRTPYFIYSRDVPLLHIHTHLFPPTPHTHNHHITTRSLKQFHEVGRASSSTGSPLLIIPCPFPWPWFRWIVDRDIRNLGNSFARVNSLMTMHLASFRESKLLPLCTRVLNICTFRFRAPAQTSHCAS